MTFPSWCREEPLPGRHKLCPAERLAVQGQLDVKDNSDNSASMCETGQAGQGQPHFDSTGNARRPEWLTLTCRLLWCSMHPKLGYVACQLIRRCFGVRRAVVCQRFALASAVSVQKVSSPIPLRACTWAHTHTYRCTAKLGERLRSQKLRAQLGSPDGCVRQRSGALAAGRREAALASGLAGPEGPADHLDAGAPACRSLPRGAPPRLPLTLPQSAERPFNQTHQGTHKGSIPPSASIALWARP